MVSRNIKGEIVVELCKYMRALTYLKRSEIGAGCIRGASQGKQEVRAGTIQSRLI